MQDIIRRRRSHDSDSSSNAGISAPELNKDSQKMRHSVGRRRSVQDIIRRRRSHLMDDQEEQRSHGGAWMPPPSRFPAPVGWKPPTRAERAARDGGQTVRRGGGQTARGDGGQTERYGGQTARNRLVQRSRPRPIQAAHGGDTARDRPPTQRTLGAARMASREEASLRKQPGQIESVIELEAEQEEAQAEVGESVRPEPAALGAPHDVTITIPADETRNLSCGGPARPDDVAETAHASLDRLQALGVRSFLSDSERTSCGLEPTGSAGCLASSRTSRRQSHRL